MRAQDLPEVLRNEVEARRVYWDSQVLDPVQAKWRAVASAIRA